MQTEQPVNHAITLATGHKIYHQGNVEKALENIQSDTPDLHALYKKMLQRGEERYLVRPSTPHCLDALELRCPNFGEVIAQLKGDILLASKGNESMSFTPILLLGDPGVGKTHFASLLANLLGTGYQFIPMSSMTAGWILSGAHPSWKSAKQGKISEVLINGFFANPVVLIDEIDKASGSNSYDPLGSLYTLLESDTAKNFTDEFVNVVVDASRIIWFATANNEHAIPEAILSRMDVHVIASLTREETMCVARTIYEEILSEHDWGFVPETSPEILEKMNTMPPRQIVHVLMSAFRTAIADNRDHLIASDIKKVTGKGKMGF